MKKILIVDDEIDIISSTKKLLENNGYSVISSKNVQDAIEKIKEEKPDLILLDLLMPGKPVEYLFEKVKEIKIIIFSVISPEEKDSMTNGKELDRFTQHKNVVGYINKPYDNTELLSLIKQNI